VNETDGTGTTPAQATAPRRLYRRVDGKMLAGVAAGLGDYFSLDPIFFRIAFVVLTITGGVGMVAYGLLWWLVPPSAEISSPAEDTMRRLKNAPLWVAVILLVVGGALLVDQAGWWRPDIVWGAALVGLGVLLFYESRARVATTAEHAPAPAVPAQPEPARGVPPPWALTTAEQATVATRRRQRSGLGLATVGMALVATGVAAVLDNLGLVRLSLAQYLALPVVILGLGTLVGTWFGRARWLAILAVPLMGMTLMAGLVTVPLEGGFGDRLIQPVTVRAADRPFRMIAGRTVLDLSALSPRRPASVTATVVAGTLEVMVPRHARLDVRAELGAGEIAMLGAQQDGLRLSERRQVGPPGGPRLSLHLAASFGRIVVFWR
jgi:phage shock protein PspC (stress-responsive transcriptional regulator)